MKYWCKGEEECPYKKREEFKLSSWQLKLKIVFGVMTFAMNIFSMMWYAFPALFDYDLTDSKVTRHCCFQFYFFYLTHLTLCFQSLYYISSLFLYYFHAKHGAESNSCVYAHHIMRTSSIIGITVGIGIAVFYWILLNKNYNLWYKNVLRISQHGMSALFLLIDDICNNIWFRYKDALILYIFTTFYILLLVIHWLSNMGRAKDTKNPGYIYEVLNFHQDTTKVFMICVVLQIVITILYLFIVFIKKKLIKYKISLVSEREQEPEHAQHIEMPSMRTSPGINIDSQPI
eukprot:145975_1